MLGRYMPHPTVKIEISKMVVGQNTRKILGICFFLKLSLGLYACGRHTLPSMHVRAHVAKHVKDDPYIGDITIPTHPVIR